MWKRFLCMIFGHRWVYPEDEEHGGFYVLVRCERCGASESHVVLR